MLGVRKTLTSVVRSIVSVSAKRTHRRNVLFLDRRESKGNRDGCKRDKPWTPTCQGHKKDR